VLLLAAYLLVMFALLIAFTAIAIYAISQPTTRPA
jgi:hypothetical protein